MYKLTNDHEWKRFYILMQKTMTQVAYFKKI